MTAEEYPKFAVDADPVVTQDPARAPCAAWVDDQVTVPPPVTAMMSNASPEVPPDPAAVIADPSVPPSKLLALLVECDPAGCTVPGRSPSIACTVLERVSASSARRCRNTTAPVPLTYRLPISESVATCIRFSAVSPSVVPCSVES